MPYAAHIPEQAAKKRAYDAAHYVANRAGKLARAGAYYEANKAAVLAKHREAYAKIATPRILLSAEEKAARRSAGLKRWRQANPEKWKAQTRSAYEANKEVMLVRMRNNRARRKSAEGKHTVADLRDLRARQKNNCAFCAKPLGAATPDVDHYIPLSKGGENGIKNLRLLHSRCNRSKHAKHPLDFGLQHGLLAW